MSWELGLSPGLGEAGLDSPEPPRAPCRPVHRSLERLLQACPALRSLGVSSGPGARRRREVWSPGPGRGERPGLFAAPRAESGRNLSQEPERLAPRPPFSPRASACCSHVPRLSFIPASTYQALEQQCLLPAASVRTAAT